MPGQVYNNPKITVNTVDLSADADKATVSQSLDSVDITPFGATSKVITPGLGDAKMTVEFFTDYRSGGPNATLKAMYDNSKNGIAGTVVIQPTNTTVSATNPSATMVAFLMNYDGFDGATSDASKFTAEFVNAGTAGIVWGTV